MGQVAPGSVVLIETVADAEAVDVPDPDRLAYSTQTTLSVADTAAVVAVLRRRFPGIDGPRNEDICYATTNRQRAVARSRRASTCSWSWAPPTRPTRCGWSRSPASTAPAGPS